MLQWRYRHLGIDLLVRAGVGSDRVIMTQSTLTRPDTSWLARVLQLLFFAGLLAVITAVLAVGGVAAFQARYRDRVYPGVWMLGKELSGLTRSEAERALAAAFTYPEDAQFTFRHGERRWTATAAELGVQLDAAASAELAFQVGRLGEPAGQLNDQGYALWYRVDLAPVVVYDQARAAAVLGRIGAEINRPAEEAMLALSGTQVQYTPGRAGEMLDVPATLERLNRPVAGLQPAELDLVVTPVEPALADAQAAADAAAAVLAAPITLVIAEPLEGDPAAGWTITPDQLAAMLVLQRVHDEQGPRYLVALDGDRLAEFLAPIAPLVEREMVDARFVFNDDTSELEVIAPSTPGRALDVAASVAAIQAAAGSAERRVPLALTIEQPHFHDGVTAAELGIREQLTSQTTYFLGSSADRVTNIRVASLRFHGAVIAPGEEFSFNQFLGDVSLETGFAEALIIFNGRTVQGVGGGVCQVSTTVFRASFSAGLPTAVRWPHAYRVGWYERGFGPGLDATVFAPEVDFKFLNDTAGHILVESYVNTTTGTLTFKLYGTKDRDVVVETPVVTNVVPHPPDRYEENPELAPGQIKQVDWAVDGADTTVRRVVSRNGQVLFTDSVFTRYLPWQAVYQVGPGTPIPTPTPTPAP
jgi:vancomycin resistance protein YoaR